MDSEDLKNDCMEEACGVFGIWAPGESVAKLTYLGLFALQHRGQESAGIAVADGKEMKHHKEMGLVSQVFKDLELARLTGDHAIGHVRYSTTGSSYWENAQPIISEFAGTPFALAHNGNLVNTEMLRAELSDRDRDLKTTSDSEVIAELIAESTYPTIEEAIIEACSRINGAYSVVIMTPTSVIGFRDPRGIRPLVLGNMGEDQPILSSETAGIDIVGGEFVREIEPGEMLVIDEDGLRSMRVAPKDESSLCIFEFIYFARPDSKMLGTTLYQARRRMGRTLALESPVPADIIIGVPDSGTPAAIGYAEGIGIPFGEGLIKNRYIGRTFIQPNQTIRELGIRVKLNPLSEAVAGRRVVVVDDSIVRGNTSRAIVQMLRDAGALEVHMRISSPPVAWPCFFGIDTADSDSLIASVKSVEEIGEFLGADSLSYLSIDGLIRATGNSKESFCCACLNGEYPIEIPEDLKMTKLKLEGSEEEPELDHTRQSAS